MLNNIGNKYNNTNHRTIKIKSIDSKSGSKSGSNAKDAKFRISDRVRISKYKNIFAIIYAPNWSEEVFVITTVKNITPWIYLISDHNGEEIDGRLYEKEWQKTNQTKF